MVSENGQAAQPFSTNRVNDPQLVEQLKSKGVKFSGKPDRSLLGGVLGWILPVLILLVLWNFMMRRMHGTRSGKSTFPPYTEFTCNS